LAADAAPSLVWAPELPDVGETLELEADESHYVSRVCRARIGERLLATDGRGGLAEMVLRATGRVVAAEVVSRTRRERLRVATLACGAPEGERGDWLVEKLAELGIARWQPVDCERGAWREGGARAERWHRLARAALRQSRQAWEMEIAAPVPLEAFVRECEAGGTRWFADPDGVRRKGGSDREALVVGPAEGLSPGEKTWLAGQGFEAISLGPSRLRTETAAICAAALWQAS
jgi:16S rRNA (uracil1498-N3)-methyltransferase